MFRLIKNNFLILMIFLLLPLSANAKTLYLVMLDIDNTASFNKYFRNLKIVRGDKFIVFDAQTSQFITEKKLVKANEIIFYNKPNQLNNFFDKSLNEYIEQKNEKFDIKKELFALSNEKNDFARELKTIKNFLQIYKDGYKKIKVIFFGNSYLHNAYGNNFDLGIPSDGFIYLKESEFNAFEDIDASIVDFAIFYDVAPVVVRNKMFRFYKKLFKKKFNTELKSFNITATFDADSNTKYLKKPFFKDVLKVILLGGIPSCPNPDKIVKNDLPNSGEIEIEIVNDCRKNTIISFSHNGKETQELVDNNGRIKNIFKYEVGHNLIKYKNLKGKWQTVVNDNILARQDGVIITLDGARSRVIVKGRNPLRKDGEEFEIEYVNIGAMFYPKIKNGAFEQVIAIKTGKNVFSWTDMKGIKQSKTIVFEPKCTDKVDYDEAFAKEYGILKVTLQNSCREDNSLVTFLYDNKKYLSLIEKGKTNTNIILKHGVNDIFYENFNRTNQKLGTIEIDDFKNLIRFMISYTDNVIVAMNIYEPNILIDIKKPLESIDYNNTKLYRDGHIHPQNPKSSKGDMFIVEYPSSKNYLKNNYIQEYKQVYVTRKKKQPKGNLLFYVDYFSRHESYNKMKPLCDEQSLGGVVVKYEILLDESSQDGKKFLNPSNCINGSATVEDKNIILIKKVEIK